MRKRAPIMEWHIAESEAEWEALQARPPLAPAQRSTAYRMAGLIVFLLLTSVGGWRWWSYPRPVPSPVSAPAQPPIHWGATQRLATTQFVFHFRQRDAQIVTDVAPTVDQRYTILTHNFGLTPTDAPLVVTVITTYTLETAPFRPRIFAKLTVPSPALYPTHTWSEADRLSQSLALLLIDHALGQAVRQHRIGAARYPLLDGLRLWQLWELDLPLAAWQPELVRWVYAELPAAQADQPLPLPQHYDTLCAAHTLWMAHPAQLRVPLLCTSLDQSPDRLPRRLIHQPPLLLPRLDTPVYPDEEVDAQGKTAPVNHPGTAIAVATLIAYLTQTYGEERLPDFVAALGRYESWDTLIPALFGVTAAEFEADWQSYVTQTMRKIE